MKQIFTVTKQSVEFDSHSPFDITLSVIAYFDNAMSAELYCKELTETQSDDDDSEYNIEYGFDYVFVYSSITEMEEHELMLKEQTKSNRPERN